VITGGDGRVYDTPQRTTIAAADSEVHDEPVFSRDEEDQFKAAPDHLHIQLPGSPGGVIVRQLYAEADEMCSFVGKKTNKL
jgi:hypothetical protein